jgi:hypothetical protein
MAFNASFVGPSSGNPYQVSPLNDQNLNELYGATRSLIPTQVNPLQDMISQGMNSPLFAQIIQAALGHLLPGEAQSRQAVTDAARSAGSLRSTAYGQSVAKNEQNILTNRSGLIGDTLAKTLGTLVPGYLESQKQEFMPGQNYMELLKMIRPDVVANRGGASGNLSGYGGADGIGPSIFDPGYDAMIADWQRRMNPSYGGGFAGTGVNTGGRDTGSAISGPAPNQPYGGYGLTGGGTGYTNQPYYGPASSGPYVNPQSLISYGPWEDVSTT